MTDELTTTEKNALKWVLFMDHYRGLLNEGETYSEKTQWSLLKDYLSLLGVDDD